MMSAGIVMRIIFVWSGFTGCVSEDGSAAASIAPARSSKMAQQREVNTVTANAVFLNCFELLFPLH